MIEYVAAVSELELDVTVMLSPVKLKEVSSLECIPFNKLTVNVVSPNISAAYIAVVMVVHAVCWSQCTDGRSCGWLSHRRLQCVQCRVSKYLYWTEWKL